jgi:hypothetical protein
MGAIAVRAAYKGGLTNAFLAEFFSLLPHGLMGMTLNDDVRIATRFHSEGIDVDLYSHHPYGASDADIMRLAVQLREFFNRHEIPSDVFILRVGVPAPGITPIASLPTT